MSIENLKRYSLVSYLAGASEMKTDYDGPFIKFDEAVEETLKIRQCIKDEISGSLREFEFMNGNKITHPAVIKHISRMRNLLIRLNF